MAHIMVRRSTTKSEPVRQIRVTLTATAPSKDDISRVMAAMGRRGGKIGGKRRLETMTPEQRSAVARKAAKSRWVENED